MTVNPTQQGAFVPGVDTGSEPPDGAAAEEHPMLDGDEFATDVSLDPLAGGVGGRRLGGGTVIVVAVVITAIAGLFSMKKLAEVTAVAGIDREIEQTIEKFLNTIRSTESEGTLVSSQANDAVVLAVLGETYSERQIPLRDIQRDPFIIALPEIIRIEPTDAPQVDASERERREHERRLAEMRQRRMSELQSLGEGFRLTAILGGSTPIATINGRTVRVGESLTAGRNDDEFRVESIDSDHIMLVSEAPELELTVRVRVDLGRGGR